MFKNKIILILWLLLPLTLLPAEVSLAYNAEPTHQDLTRKIVEIYNKSNSPQITPEQLNWIIDGVIKEDTAPRWINHFYDPIYKVGWSGEKQGDVPQETVNKLSSIFLSSQQAASSLNWLHAETLQDKYGLYEGNQTYEQALNAYAYSQNQKAGLFLEVPNGMSFQSSFEALGHTLHLLEDLGVPAHVRNDTHADVSGTNDSGDPYEKWASQLGNDNFSNLNSVSGSFSCAGIDDCFIKLATYTNENFYSKDTIDEQKYKILTADFKKDINNDEFLVFRKDSFQNSYPFEVYNRKINKFSIENDQIHQAYWNLLSKQIVLAGVEVVKNFYSDAQKEAENIQYQPHAVTMNKCDIPFICTNTMVSPFGEITKVKNAAGSFIGNVVNAAQNIFSSAGGLITNFFSNNNNLKQITQVDLAAQTENSVGSNQTNVSTDTSASKTSKNPTEVQNLKTQIVDLKKEVTALNKELNKQTAIAPAQDVAVAKNNTTSTVTDNSAQKTATSQTAVSFCNFSTSQQPKHTGVILNEIAWMGSIKSTADEWVELKNISSEGVDLANWQLISKDGQIKINFSDLKNQKIGDGSHVLLERTDDNTVLGIAADLIYKGGLANTDEKLRLFDSNCNLIDEVTANPNWSAGDKDFKKTMERNTDGSAASASNQFGWHTSDSAGGTPRANNSLQQGISFGGGGGVSATTATTNTQTVTQESPIFYEMAINEIMYNPDGTDTGREWIEIFNKSISTVDLTEFKISEGGTNHGLTLKQGEKNLVPGGYAVLVSDRDKFLTDYPDYAGIIFESPFSLSNNGENLIFKNKDLKIDEINYASSTGAYDNGKSLQLISGEWKESTPTPGEENILTSENLENSNATTTTVIVNAQFSFSPTAPKENEIVNFDAVSSTVSSGTITLYEWNFGDNISATSTESQIAHTFQVAGIYNAQLTVYGENNASSTIGTEINVDAQAQQGNRHILISEIMPGINGNVDNEFVELYNPTNQDVSFSGWSLVKKSSESATSTKNLVLDFEASTKIAANGFFLVGHNSYIGTPDFRYTNNSNPLANNGDVVILKKGDTTIDEVVYPAINEGQSFERKALNNDICVSAQGDGEFLGNGCDTGDSANDFEVRAIPNPQNFANFSEPRNAPTQVQNFNIQYDATSTQLIFNWTVSSDYSGLTSGVNYKIVDISNSANKLQNIETSSTLATAVITETGRTGDNNYKFSIQPFDGEGLVGAVSESSIDVPNPLNKTLTYLITQTVVDGWSHSFGYKWDNCSECDEASSFQSIVPDQNFQFNKVILRFRQSMANDTTNLRLSVQRDYNGMPSSTDILGESIHNLYNPVADLDVDFPFNNPISFTAGEKYWLVLDVSGYWNGNSDYFRNRWENAISTGDNYKNGEAGYCEQFGCGIPYPNGADWYMKIGMEQ